MGQQRLRAKLVMVGIVLALLLLVGGLVLSINHWMRGSRDVPAAEDSWFEDITDESGVDFVHDAGDLSQYNLPQIHGSGVALFDLDGDGLLDIYLLTHGGPNSPSINRLYKNLGGGRFRDVTAGSGLGIAGYNTGVSIGDVN